MIVASYLGAALMIAATSASMAGAADVTPELRQKATQACGADAVRLCPDAIGDDQQMLACMKPQRAQLTAPCRQVYDQVARVLKQ